MRLIDVDAIRVKPEYMENVCGIAMIRAEDLARILNEQPTIPGDEELVRCGDCVNGEPFENGVMCNCEAHEKDWFCADGKRA